MSTEDFGFEWVAPNPADAPTPEQREEALDRYYYDAPPTRCPVCFNVDAYCSCRLIARGQRMHPAQGRVSDAENVDRILSAPDRERLFADYVTRGVEEFERMLTDDG